MSFWDSLIEALPTFGGTLYIAFGLAFLAGIVRGFAGFGTAMVLSAPMAVLYSPAIAVPILSIIDPVASIRLFRQASKVCNWRVVAVITGGAFVGSPIGVYTLSVIDPEVMSKVIAVILLISVGLLASGWHFKGEPGVALTGATGMSAGFLGGLSGIAGPPVVLFLLGSKMTAQVTRANVIMFFFFGTFVSVLAFLWTGLMTLEVVVLGVTLLPPYLVGLSVGSFGFGWGGEKYYRPAVLGLVALIGIISLLS